MSDRGRSRTPKSLTRSPSPSHSRSRSPLKTTSTSRNGDASTGGAVGVGGSRVIVVSGLSKNVQKGHLEEIFGEYGKITGLDLPLFKVSGLNRGKAAIEFDRASEAEKAVKHMDGGQLDGSFLSVQISEHPLPPPQPQSPVRRRPRSISRSRSPAYRRRRSPTYSRSPSPVGRRGSNYRRRSLSRSRSPPPRGGPGGFRGGRDTYIPSGGGRGGGYGGGPRGPGPRRDRSPLPVRRPGERGAPRRPSPEYVRGGRRSFSPRSRSRGRGKSYSRSRSRSYSSVSRSRSPAPRRKRYTPSRSRSRSRSRSMSIDSRSRSPSRSAGMRSVSPKK
ncbi:hypothetical protein CI109_102630 [Kwoniella shandongensis]|uniref:RRM domain-containing protein n=1 Tax=Kwoniella shandongensis TaxID=1734106 RepID=A0AAJ8LGQ2_9TREE